MKSLSPIIDNKDLVTKEYVDTSIPDISNFIEAVDPGGIATTSSINVTTLNGHPDTDFSLVPSVQTLDGYTIATTESLPTSSDTINVAFGKIAKILDGLDILLASI